MRVRTTQELLDSRLALVGWRVYVDTDAGRSYATGAGTWTPDRARAFLFTDAPHSARKGNDDGLRWAKAHARHLVGEHTKAQWPSRDPDDDEGYDVLKPRIVCIRRRIWATPVRDAIAPCTTSDPTAEKA